MSETGAKPLAEEHVGGLLIGLIVMLALAQVFSRYVAGQSLSWSEELVRYMFVTLTFVGVSGNLRRGEHLSVRLLPDRWRASMVASLPWLRAVFVAAFAGVVLVAGVEAVASQMRSEHTTPALALPRWIVVAVVPTTMAAACVGAIQAVARPIGK